MLFWSEPFIQFVWMKAEKKGSQFAWLHLLAFMSQVACECKFSTWYATLNYVNAHIQAHEKGNERKINSNGLFVIVLFFMKLFSGLKIWNKLNNERNTCLIILWIDLNLFHIYNCSCFTTCVVVSFIHQEIVFLVQKNW